LSPRQYVIQNA